MKTDIAVDYNFNSEQDAAEAIKVLSQAGFEEVELTESVPESEAYTDFGQPPPREMLHSIIKGGVSGMIGGVVFATMMIEVPATIMETGFHGPYIAAALIFGAILGGLVGLWLSLIWAKRIHLQNASDEPQPIRRGYLLRVWVDSNEGSQQVRRVLGRFAARLPHPSV